MKVGRSRIEYDPLLSKLIGYGADRAQAIGRLTRALDEYFVGGIKTNLSLFRRIFGDTDFRAGRFDTGYLDRLLKASLAATPGEESDVAAVAAGVFAILDAASAGNSPRNGGVPPIPNSAWKKMARNEALSMNQPHDLRRHD